MNNATAAASNTYTLSSSGSTGWYCSTHAGAYCNCLNANASFNHNSYWIQCAMCQQWYDGSQYSNQHICMGISPAFQGFTFCSACSQSYPSNTFHVCTNLVSRTTTGTTWNISPSFKEVKEITTDSELIYEWNGGSFDITLPAKFSDCFLKVGYTWSPLYPLIFSAVENNSKEISFHLIVGITDKVFEGDKVILKAVTTTKIEDNLTLLQLTQRVKEYFKDDSSNPAV